MGTPRRLRHSHVCVFLLTGVLLTLAACGVSAIGTSQPAPTLHCAFTTLHGNVFQGGLSCKVDVYATASDETAFTLTYSVNSATCRGSLANGTGSCALSFPIYSFPLTSLGTVSGEVLPDRHPLGPVIPQSVPPIVLGCAFSELPAFSQTGETFTGSLACQVNGTASDETAFTLTYSENNAVCRGSLADGFGTCTVSFPINDSLTSLGTVSGEVLPSHRPLGPVAPVPEP